MGNPHRPTAMEEGAGRMYLRWSTDVVFLFEPFRIHSFEWYLVAVILSFVMGIGRQWLSSLHNGTVGLQERKQSIEGYETIEKDTQPKKKVKLLMGFVLTLARLWLGYALIAHHDLQHGSCPCHQLW